MGLMVLMGEYVSTQTLVIHHCHILFTGGQSTFPSPLKMAKELYNQNHPVRTEEVCTIHLCVCTYMYMYMYVYMYIYM